MLKKLDNKGMTFVETIVVVIITFIAIYTINSFNVTLANHKETISKYISLNQTVEGEISQIYSEANWESLDNKEYTVNDNNENIVVNVSYKLTSHSTDKLVVGFTLDNGYNKAYNIERSIYHEQ